MSEPYQDHDIRAGRPADEPFRACVDALPDALTIWTARRDAAGVVTDFTVAYVNAAAVAAAGLSREELVGRSLSGLLPEGERERRIARLRRIVETGEPYRGHEDAYECALLNPPRLGWYDCQVVRLGDGVMTTWRDATEQHKTGLALEGSEERYRRQAEELDGIWLTAPIGLSIVDRDLVIQKMNERLAEMNGVPLEQALGRPGPALSPVVNEQLAPLVRSVVETGRPVVGVEVSGVNPGRPDAPWHWLCSYSPLTDEAGRVEAVSCVVQDVTDYRRALLELEEARASLEQRVADRTAALRARAAQLRDLAAQLADTEQRERRRLAEMLHDEVQQFLVAAQMQLKSVRPHLPGKSAAVIEQASSLVARAIQVSRSLSVELRPPVLYEAGLGPAVRWLAEQFGDRHALAVTVEGELDIEGGDDRMRALLFEATRELLFNVVEHAGVPSARVRLERLPDGSTAVQVEDAGCGFEPRALTRSGRHGLGLFGIRERLEALGGRVVVDTAPGDGARISLEAPDRATARAVPPEDASSAAAPAAVTPGGPVRVLVVDDHEVVRAGIAQFLAAEPDLEVVGEADDGPTAVCSARRLRPDVVLMDVNLPRLNGIEATRVIVRELPATTVVGLSIHDDASTAASMAEAGAAAYLTKDGPLDRILEAVRRLARRTN